MNHIAEKSIYLWKHAGESMIEQEALQHGDGLREMLKCGNRLFRYQAMMPLR